jgi:hypothetical protein
MNVRSIARFRFLIDLVLILALTFGSIAINLAYSNVASFVAICDIATRGENFRLPADIKLMKLEEMGVSRYELGTYYDKEITCFLMLGLSLILLNLALYLIYRYRHGPLPTSKWLYYWPLAYWVEDFLNEKMGKFARRSKLFTLITVIKAYIFFQVFVFSSFFLILWLLEWRYAGEFVSELAREGLLKESPYIGPIFDYRDFFLFLLISITSVALFEYMSYLLSKKRGGCFLHFFLYNTIVGESSLKGEDKSLPCSSRKEMKRGKDS